MGIRGLFSPRRCQLPTSGDAALAYRFPACGISAHAPMPLKAVKAKSPFYTPPKPPCHRGLRLSDRWLIGELPKIVACILGRHRVCARWATRSHRRALI